MFTTHPCPTTAVSLRVVNVSGRGNKSRVTDLNLYPYSQAFTISAIIRSRYKNIIPSSVWPPGSSGALGVYSLGLDLYFLQ